MSKLYLSNPIPPKFDNIDIAKIIWSWGEDNIKLLSQAMIKNSTAPFVGNNTYDVAALIGYKKVNELADKALQVAHCIDDFDIIREGVRFFIKVSGSKLYAEIRYTERHNFVLLIKANDRIKYWSSNTTLNLALYDLLNCIERIYTTGRNGRIRCVFDAFLKDDRGKGILPLFNEATNSNCGLSYNDIIIHLYRSMPFFKYDLLLSSVYHFVDYNEMIGIHVDIHGEDYLLLPFEQEGYMYYHICKSKGVFYLDNVKESSVPVCVSSGDHIFYYHSVYGKDDKNALQSAVLELRNFTRISDHDFTHFEWYSNNKVAKALSKASSKEINAILGYFRSGNLSHDDISSLNCNFIQSYNVLLDESKRYNLHFYDSIFEWKIHLDDDVFIAFGGAKDLKSNYIGKTFESKSLFLLLNHIFRYHHFVSLDKHVNGLPKNVRNSIGIDSKINHIDESCKPPSAHKSNVAFHHSVIDTSDPIESSVNGESSGQMIIETYDPVKPSHYRQYDMEVIDMMKRIFGKDKVMAFCELNAFKYRMRMGLKENTPASVDLSKEAEYLQILDDLKKDKR